MNTPTLESKELVVPGDFVFNTQNMSDMNSVFIYEKERCTTSWFIARDFEKKHKHVLDIINKIMCDLEEIEGPIFRPRDYIDSRGKTQPMYLLDKVAFEMVVLSFIGKKYTKLKYEYVKKFNHMEKCIEEPQQLRNNQELKLLTKLVLYVDKLNKRVEAVEKNTKEDEVIETKRLELPEPPEISDRTHLVSLVNTYAAKHNRVHVSVYNMLYSEINKRLHMNIYTRVKNRNNMKPIEYLEQEGYLPEVISIAVKIFKNNKNEGE